MNQLLKQDHCMHDPGITDEAFMAFVWAEGARALCNQVQSTSLGLMLHIYLCGPSMAVWMGHRACCTQIQSLQCHPQDDALALSQNGACTMLVHITT